eukprot:9641745-Karenia_brevis.AAC.1
METETASESPSEFARRLIHLTLTTVAREEVILKRIQILMDRWVRALQCGRECAIYFHHCWRAMIRWRGRSFVLLK